LSVSNADGTVLVVVVTMTTPLCLVCLVHEPGEPGWPPVTRGSGRTPTGRQYWIWTDPVLDLY
jgi:hypothetical protein